MEGCPKNVDSSQLACFRIQLDVEINFNVLLQSKVTVA